MDEFALCPQDVGVILTYRCHSGCAHCIYNCGPRREKTAMSAEVLRQALEAIATWPQPPQIHLTGGEPFLHFDLLVEGARVAAKLGIAAYVETSAAWCTDYDQALEQFSTLKAAGLQAVLISCSPFHAEHIPLVRTVRAARAAIEVFGAHRVTVYQAQFLDLMRQFDQQHPVPLTRYEETFGVEKAYQILWLGFGLISGGRSSYRLGHLVPKQPAEAFAHATCANSLLYAQHSHFDLHGHYVPGFCGGLTIGSWHDLPQMLADFQAGQYPPLIALLVERGPYGLFELARDDYGYPPPPDGYAGKCHLCVDVRRHLIQAGTWQELAPSVFYEHL